MKLSLGDWPPEKDPTAKFDRKDPQSSTSGTRFCWDRQSFPTLIERNNQTLASDCADKSDGSGCSKKSDRMEIRLHRTKAARAAEKFAMHLMTQLKSNRLCKGSGMLVDARRTFRLAGFTFALIGLASLSGKFAYSQVVHADADYEAAGYVTPAGMVPPTMYQGSVQPVGFFSGSPASSCDAYGGCDSYGYAPTGCDSCGCSNGGCDGASGHWWGSGGILGRLANGEGCGCASCLGGCCTSCFGGGGSSGSGLSSLRHFCIFCRGSGCEACQLVGNGQILGMLGALLPYSEAGICAQRWYDLSAEAVFLGHNSGGFTGDVTSQGIAGPRVLSIADADAGGDLQAGARLSGALIFGAGGNIEGTWMGGQKWNSTASFTDPNYDPNNALSVPGLFSFISNFGDLPTTGAGGFDDTDRSITQSVNASSDFNSFELNYRRRTVGPYCRFQGSWLAGLRYVRYNDGLLYSTTGTINNTGNANLPRFFSSDERTENKLFGAQLGFDLWWNVVAGVNLGIGAKGAWMQNDIDRQSVLTANSIGPNATPGTATVVGGDQNGTVLGEFEAKMVYRLTHSWSLRTAYYAVAIDEIAFSGIDVDNSRIFANVNNNAPLTSRPVTFDSLVLQGFSIGAEYIW